MRLPIAPALALLFAVVGACQASESVSPNPLPAMPSASASTSASAGATSCSGDVLFGRPNARTGLTEDQCKPRCACGGEPFDAPLYTQTDIDALLTWTLDDPPAALTADPYADPPPDPPPPDELCGVLPNPSGARTYTLVTYPSAAAAKDAGATPTHYGPCGLCSSLVNLGVYMKYPDLTAPVRDCGVKGLGGDEAAQLACLEQLGFEHACAQIWSYNTDHTRTACLDTCIAALGKPYQDPDGTLNPCLQCDEDKSGPVFKHVAGRTRRNTGIANALCRPCSEVRPLLHDYATK